MRTLPKLLLFIIGSAAVARISGFVIARQLDEGSEVSDEFRRVVILNGADFNSRALGLRSGELSVVLGAAKLDLREATLDPAGARLLIENTLGGLAVTVRDDWAVTVDEVLVGGGETTVDVTAPADLPEDAPRLEIEAITRMGGTVIGTGSIDL